MIKNNERELELHTIQQIMSTENGRLFIYRCLQYCGTYGSIFSNDSMKHAYNSGLRDAGIWIENEVKEATIDNYLKMIKENENG